MIGMVSAAMYGIFALGFLGCAAYAVVMTVLHFTGKR